MYVREDFRNMLSQGISIAPDNLLWSKDVSKLLKLMKQSVEDDEKDVIDAHVIKEEDVEMEISRFDETKEHLKDERKVAVNLEGVEQPSSGLFKTRYDFSNSGSLQ